MNLSEHLKPSDNADRKRVVGANTPEVYPTTAEIPPESRAPAIRAVAARARDADDARDLLEHLGLIEPRTPTATWKRSHKSRGGAA